MMGRLRAAIKVLPESMSLIVQMVVIDGYSYKDAAKELRIPVGTVRSRLSRARESLKEAVIG
jgi:RNA polymerase sigma-70 factor (ECF subfamily)